MFSQLSSWRQNGQTNPPRSEPWMRSRTFSAKRRAAVDRGGAGVLLFLGFGFLRAIESEDSTRTAFGRPAVTRNRTLYPVPRNRKGVPPSCPPRGTTEEIRDRFPVAGDPGAGFVLDKL